MGQRMKFVFSCLGIYMQGWKLEVVAQPFPFPHPPSHLPLWDYVRISSRDFFKPTTQVKSYLYPPVCPQLHACLLLPLLLSPAEGEASSRSISACSSGNSGSCSRCVSPLCPVCQVIPPKLGAQSGEPTHCYLC